MRYDPQYDAFKEARREELAVPDKDGNMSADRKVADWNRAIALGTALLSKSTKDLQLAAWMTEALLVRQGVSGLHTGIQAKSSTDARTRRARQLFCAGRPAPAGELTAPGGGTLALHFQPGI
jgi:predicted component of type VI protein secretion system